MWQIVNGLVDEVGINVYFKGPGGGDKFLAFLGILNS